MKLILEMSPEEINQELCKRLGIAYHKHNPGCIHMAFPLECKQGKNDPDFYSNPGKIQLLREMYNKGEWFFIWDLEDLIIDKDGLLAKMALRWLRKEEG